MKHIPRKRFGQNFLNDPYIIQKIIECINPKPGQKIVEIGPGLGALTKPLIEHIGHLDVVELDRNIIDLLKQSYAAKNLTIHEGDALKFDFRFTSLPIRVVGNLPYNISTPLLFYLSAFSNIQNMIFMLQKEVVERICAVPNTADYGKLTVMLQYKFRCQKLLDVPPESFYPRPKVDSAVISLTPRTDYDWHIIDENRLNQVVSHAFNQRRKTITNSLRNFFTPGNFMTIGINPQSRAENLTIEQFLILSQLSK